MKQRTVARSTTIEGIGLHSGKKVTLTLSPSEVDTGINFLRTDIANAPLIRADAYLVKDTMMSSNLVVDDIKIGTVEHLLSAIAGLGIDNLLIKVSDAEIPIMDGSAKPYITELLKVGFEEQTALKHFMRLRKKVRVKHEDKWAQIIPFEGFALSFEIDFNHPAIPENTQRYTFDFSTKNYLSSLSNARTFGFMRDIEQLKQNNLALGGSLDNAIVLDDTNILNTTGLRHPDEFVRHKILDAVGDLYLSKYPLLGHFEAYKSGHTLNNQLIRAIYDDKSNFEIVTFYDESLVPIDYSL